MGEIKGSLGIRVSEHCTEGSPNAEHRNRGQNIRSELVLIIDKGPAWFTRSVREAVYIRIYKGTLNMDGGRY